MPGSFLQRLPVDELLGHPFDHALGMALGEMTIGVSRTICAKFPLDGLGPRNYAGLFAPS
jgi:hypothetical protein